MIKAQPGVISFKNLRTRKVGSSKFIEFDIVVDGGLSVVSAHELTDHIISNIEKALSNTTVTIHIEPCLADCPPACRPNCVSPSRKT
jgi:divalent metal cation (Fe/Co/Zn/Cd) transporter